LVTADAARADEGAATDAATPPASSTALYAIPTTRDQIGRIVAPVMVNGRGPFRFMIDTGANHTVISAALMPVLGLVADPQLRISVRGVNGTIMAPSAHVTSLDAGSMHYREVQVPVLAGPVLTGIDGILGLDTLDHRSLTADFEHDRIGIGQAFSGAPLGDDVVPARLVSQHLFEIDGLVGNVHVKAIIDTGGPRSLGNLALWNALRRGANASVGAVPTNVVDATEVLQSASFEQVASMRFGKTTLTKPYVTFGDFQVFKMWGLEDQPALLLGMDVLGVFAEMTIDYRRLEFGLRPRSEMLALH
jgi:predicted aspartyl protease